MAHAVDMQVKLDPNSDMEHRHAILRDNVIPEVKALPGFLKESWMNDGVGIGTCAIVFDTKDQARATVTPMSPAGGPLLINSGVFEVEV